jgi:hypothetical protein
MSFRLDDLTDVDKKLPDVAGLIPWLPTPHRCECGAYCTADVQYVESQGMPVDVWVCPDCETRYYRDEDSLTGDIR